MKFVNLTDKTLRFDVAGKAFEVATFAECDVDDAFAFVVKKRGLPLTPAAAVEPAKPAQVVVKSAAEPAQAALLDSEAPPSKDEPASTVPEPRKPAKR